MTLAMPTATATEVAAPPPPTPSATIPILVVDDERGIRDSLALYLRRQGFAVTEAEDGEQALRLVQARNFPLVLCDISLPGETNGLDILAYLKKNRPDAEVMMMTGHLDVNFAIEALKHGAFDYFKKPFLFDEIQHALRRALERRKLMSKARELQRLRLRQETLAEFHTQFMISLAHMIDAKSTYTRAHSDRVSVYARELGKVLGLSAAELRRITTGGKLHDIGKIGTPEEILNKPGPLTAEERRIICEHPVCGAELLRPLSIMEPYLGIVRWHHENWDGSGYPDGVKGEKIPLAVQVVKISDYYDAITSNRPYREPMTLSQAITTLESEAGRAFHPDVVGRFVQLIQNAPWDPRRKIASQGRPPA